MIQTAIDVKTWMKNLPSVEAVRPASCPRCKVASRPLGGRLNIYGHGLRLRSLWGPIAPEDDPDEHDILLRRYLCQKCGAVIVAGPGGVVHGRRYSGVAIALAFLLYGVRGLSHPVVRKCISPWRSSTRDPARTQWVTLLRWVEAQRARQIFGALSPPPSFLSHRQLAEHTAQALGAIALTSETSLDKRVVAGSMQVR